MPKWFVASIVVPLVLVASAASAQEKGQFGLTMGYPAAVGFTWHLSDSVAVKPDFTFSKYSSDTSTANVPGTGYDSTAWEVAVAAVFYTHRWDRLTTYVTPRFGFGGLKNTNRFRSQNGTTSSSSTTSNPYSVTGSIGAQYSLSPRFGLFGEVGYGYSHQTVSGRTTTQTQTDSFIHSVAGVILYLR